MILTAPTGPYFAKNMPRFSSVIAEGRFDYDAGTTPREVQDTEVLITTLTTKRFVV